MLTSSPLTYIEEPMFAKSLAAATLLTAVLPSATATQTTITTITKGVITSADWFQHTNIRPGETFELTSVMRFDPTWIETVTPEYQRVQGSAEYTFRVADRTYQYTTRQYGAYMNFYSYDFGSRGGRFHLSTALKEGTGNNRNWQYSILSQVEWTSNMYTLPDLFRSDSYEYTYAAPFGTYLTFLEFGYPSEPTGDIETNVTSIHLLVSSVPEPATYAMLGAGLGLMALLRRKRRTETETCPA